MCLIDWQVIHLIRHFSCHTGFVCIHCSTLTLLELHPLAQNKIHIFIQLSKGYITYYCTCQHPICGGNILVWLWTEHQFITEETNKFKVTVIIEFVSFPAQAACLCTREINWAPRWKTTWTWWKLTEYCSSSINWPPGRSKHPARKRCSPARFWTTAQPVASLSSCS